MTTIATSATVFPSVDWETGTPESHGLDSARVAEAVADIMTIDKRFGCLVAKDGVIIHETYIRNVSATNRIFSITKGLGATLVGIAQHQGLLHTDDLVRDWLPVHHPEIADDATIGHVLNMTAGTEPAGSVWRYNSNFILNSIPGILWQASGMTPHAFFTRYLKEPVGFAFDWPHNANGWMQIGSQGPLPVIEATHRDIARMGLLWLNQGLWGSIQIMCPDFVHDALSPPLPDVNGAYGYLWWLNSAEGNWLTTGGRSGHGSWFPESPSNIFLALGARGKVMVVVPDHQLILVTMGETDQEQSATYVSRIMRNVNVMLGT